MALATVFSVFLILMPWHGALAGSVTALAPVADADQRFGLADILPDVTPSGQPWTQLAYNAGARTNRWEFRWDTLQPQAGQWNFSTTDPVVAQSRQAGLDVLGVIDGTPRWAVAPGQPPGNGVPRDLGLPISGTRNLWATFIRGLVTHYRGEVGYWEIWNEPDLHYFWNGNVDDYVGLLRVAYRVIKQVDPAAQVMLAGMVVPDMQFFAQLLQNARHRRVAGHLPFDLAAWHAYEAAAQVYPDLVRFKALLDSTGVPAIPVWVTEDGFPVSNPAGEPRQAAYILQTITYALAAGAARVLVYRASDDPLPKQWGVLTAGGMPRMGYVAFQIAAEYLSHTQAVTYVPDGAFERFVLYQPNRRITVFWNRTTQDQTFQLSVGHAEIGTIDWQGTSGTARAAGGAVRLPAPRASYNQGIDPTNSVIAGPPQLALEENTVPTDVRPGSYLPPVIGDQRSVQLLNAGDIPVDLVVSALDRPLQRQVIRVAARTLTSADLDLLGGIDYTGMYAIASSGTVSVLGLSTAGIVPAVSSSPNWYLASSPAEVTLRNTSVRSATIEITGYGHSGRRRVHRRLVLDAGAATTWTVPDAGTRSATALTVHATAPIVLVGPQSIPVGAASAPTFWYLVAPREPKVVLFNAGGRAATIDAQLVGGAIIRRVQLHVGAHRSFVLSTRGAKAVVLNSGRELAVGYRASDFPAPLPNIRPDVRAGITAAGDVTRVDLFNPSAHLARVTLRIGAGAQVRTVTQAVPPGGIRAVFVRSAGSAATGVIVRSDVPIVAAPA